MSHTRGLTPQEIRVLQEFRRIDSGSMTFDEIRKIKHPAGGGDAPAHSLVEKGYLTLDGSAEKFTLTALATEFLAYDPVPGVEPWQSTVNRSPETT